MELPIIIGITIVVIALGMPLWARLLPWIDTKTGRARKDWP